MNTTSLVLTIVAVIAIAIIAVVALKIARKKQSERLREQYGPEYDRAVDRSGNQREAESELRDREKRHKKLDLKELNQQQRDGYDRRWTELQAQFVDDPSQAVRGADHLVVEIMKVRGYPVDDFDQRADTLSVSHPQVTQGYREAREIARSNEDGSADTEDLRQAVTSYRALVRALVHGEATDRRRDDTSAPDARTDAGRTDAGPTEAGRSDAAGEHREQERNGHRESVPTRTQETKRENS